MLKSRQTWRKQTRLGLWEYSTRGKPRTSQKNYNRNQRWQAGRSPHSLPERSTRVEGSLDRSLPHKKGAIMHRDYLKRYIRSLSLFWCDGQLDGSDRTAWATFPIWRKWSWDYTKGWDSTEESEEQRQQLKSLLDSFNDTFYSIPGLTDQTTIKIDTRKNAPTNKHPTGWKGKLSDKIQTLLRLGIIRLSRSAWAAPVVCVVKPDGSLRMVCGLLGTQCATALPDSYPMPRIEELMDRVAPAAAYIYVSPLDLAKSSPFGRVIKEEDSIHYSNGEIWVQLCTFWTLNYTLHFSKNDGQPPLTCHSPQHIIDDIVITSQTWTEHLQHLENVYTRLDSLLKRQKCVFGKASVSFLGHKVGQGQIQPQAAKIEAIRNYQQPANKRDLWAFLGLGYYRKFIHTLLNGPLNS